MSKNQSVVTIGEVINFNVKKEMAEFRMSFDISQIEKVIPLSLGYGAKPIDILFKIGDKKHEVGSSFLAKSLNIDLKKGEIKFVCEAMLDDMVIDFESIKTMQNIEIKMKFVINDLTEELEEDEIDEDS